MRHLLFISFALLFAQGVLAQPLSGEKETFTQADTLRGTLLPERTWFDVTYYDLNIKVNPNERSLSGYNDIYF